VNKLLQLSFVSLVLFSTACAGAKAYGPSFAEAKATEARPDRALVYVFRTYAEPTGFGANVVVDGKLATMLNQTGFTWFYATPGRRELKASWPLLSGQSSGAISLPLEAGKTYYIQLLGSSQYLGHNAFQMGSGLVAVEAAEGEAALAACKFQRPEKAEY
jgi:hypothetical protein